MFINFALHSNFPNLNVHHMYRICGNVLSTLAKSEDVTSVIVCYFREQLIKWFVDLQLSEYQVIFHESEEVGGDCRPCHMLLVFKSPPIIITSVYFRAVRG